MEKRLRKIGISQVKKVEGEALFPLVDNKKSVRKYIFDSANMTNHDGDGEKAKRLS